MTRVLPGGPGRRVRVDRGHASGAAHLRRIPAATGSGRRQTRIIFSVNVDWFFLSHRLPLAVAAAGNGADVWVVAGDTGRADEIVASGLRFVGVPVSRGGTALWGEAKYLATLAYVYWRLRPDLIHHVTIKPILYGSLIARLFRRVAVVNAISGLGYAFSDDVSERWLERLSKGLYKIALSRRRTRTIFQNVEDLDTFVAQGLVARSDTVLIRGSGVDVSDFHPSEEPDGLPIVLFAGRLLREKGIAVFVEAASMLRASGAAARFVVVGVPDPDNPTSVETSDLEGWVEAAAIEWWGNRDDMADVMRAASIIVLPTWYHEGVPKVLIEAAASGRPIVTTDRPECRDIVRDRINGLLVEERRSDLVADAILCLLNSSELRHRYGAAGRQLVQREFSVEHVVSSTLALYDELLGPEWRQQDPHGSCRTW